MSVSNFCCLSPIGLRGRDRYIISHVNLFACNIRIGLLKLIINYIGHDICLMQSVVLFISDVRLYSYKIVSYLRKRKLKPSQQPRNFCRRGGRNHMDYFLALLCFCFVKFSNTSRCIDSSKVIVQLRLLIVSPTS